MGGKGIFPVCVVKLGKKDEAPKRCDFLRLRNMLLKATFPTSYLGLVEATPAAKKKWLHIRTAR